MSVKRRREKNRKSQWLQWSVHVRLNQNYMITMAPWKASYRANIFYIWHFLLETKQLAVDRNKQEYLWFGKDKKVKLLQFFCAINVYWLLLHFCSATTLKPFVTDDLYNGSKACFCFNLEQEKVIFCYFWVVWWKTNRPPPKDFVFFLSHINVKWVKMI